jgi:short subunit dehydrogenase-like uncharacterized protein
MAGRQRTVVVFGATGYTGRLTVEALAAAGCQPVLAGRDRDRLDALASRYPGARAAVADAAGPASVRALLRPGDVLISTVGPFVRYGDAAVSAAIDAGAHYVDSTGEAPFVRRVFQEYGPRAEGAGVALLTAFGYDFVPGNLAGALAARDAGTAVARVDVGYFVTGAGRDGMSSGTRASVAAGLTLPHHAYRAGRLRTEPVARRVRHFAGRPGFSVGGTEQLALPRSYPGLREVNVYLGWLGRATRLAQLASYTWPVLDPLPGARTLLHAWADEAMHSTGAGPAAAARAGTGSLVIAEAYDAAGRRLIQVTLAGVNGYDLTGRLLAWAAVRLADAGVEKTGALGPVQAFGLDHLEQACRAAGLARTADPEDPTVAPR